VIFSRGRRARHLRDGATPPASKDADQQAQEAAEAADSSVGPYDDSVAPAGVERIDLGSLLIPAVEGVEIRVQASPDGSVQQVALVHGDSALQLGALSAPRSGGLWDEVRAELRESLADASGVHEVDGEYGTQLRAQVQAPEGQVELRFVGIDGPRWMVQALYQGRAAVDPEAAGPLGACLRGLVVVRGREAMPARDPLPLRLPRELAAAAADQLNAAGGASSEA
jgi:hypothetical protein